MDVYFLQQLPFIEYNLHLRLMNKLALKKMNAIFGLKIQIAVGETMIVGVAVRTCTCINVDSSLIGNFKIVIFALKSLYSR